MAAVKQSSRYLDWQGYGVLGWLSVAALAFGAVIAATQERWWGAAWFVIASLCVVAALYWLGKRVASVFYPLLGVALAVNIAGYTWDLFATPGAYDEVVHGFTTAVIALAYGVIVFRRDAPNFVRHALLYFVAVATFGIAIAAVWEIVEWSLNQISGVSLLTGYSDTIWDLIADAGGALFAAVVCIATIARHGRARHHPVNRVA